MKKILVTTFFLIMAISVMQSQVTGRTMLYESGCYTMISVNSKMPYVTTDNNGSFSLSMPNKLNNIFILTSWISIEIVNVKQNESANIGEINVPMLKTLPINEYEKLSNDDKTLFKPVHCYTKLIDYEYKNQLSENYLTVKCGDLEYKIYDFKFDAKNSKVIIDWNSLRKCKS
jgi:hypothetical protein